MVQSVGEQLIWEHTESTRVIIVGRGLGAIVRAAAKLDLPLRNWNGVVSEAAPEEWPAVYDLAPGTIGVAAQGDDERQQVGG